MKTYKLSKDQWYLLFKKLNYENKSMKKLFKDYNVSRRTLNRLKIDMILIQRPETLRNMFKFKIHKNERVIEFMHEYLQHQVKQYNVKDVGKFIEEKIGIRYPLQKIMNMMRKEIWLFCKRINSRSCNIDYEKLQITRVLFSIRLSNFIDNDILLINIDETCLTKASKSDYSWIPIGKVGEVLNAHFTKPMNIVLVICSIGDWIEMLINDKLNADKFVTFLQNLKAWIEENNSFGFKRLLYYLIISHLIEPTK